MQCGEVVFRGQKRGEGEMKADQILINNYDLSQPICENPQLALEALKQIIQANKDGNNETAIFMTVKRCQTCGAWPTCRLDGDGKDATMVMECPQDPNHTRYIGSLDETVKDIIRAWNWRNSRIKKYDWDALIGENIDAATAALMDHVARVWASWGDPKRPVRLCRKCGAMPTVFTDEDDDEILYFGCRHEGHKRVYICATDTLNGILKEWNEEQKLDKEDEKPTELQKHKETEMATTGEMIEKYDWNEPIANNRVLAADALEACIERNFPEKSQFDGAYMYGFPAKMEILRHKNSGEIPKVIKAEDGFNIGIGVDGFCYVWANPSETLTTLVNTWNKLQGKAAKETTEEPPAKTIDELEAEADRGLSKPEDVQKLKEANVLTGSQKAIAEVCDEIKELLLEKNRKYGDSALNPCRIFARSDRLEQIRVRIDDKLNRIKNEQGDEDEDVVKDLIGYLVLYTVAQLHDFND